MTEYLSCPICGKLTPLSSFEPEDLEEDIMIVEMVSRGRRGFEVVSRQSALDDPELMEVISERLRVLLRLLDDEGTALRREENEEEAQLAKSEEENEELAALEATVENALRLLNSHLGESFDSLEEAVECIVAENDK